MGLFYIIKTILCSKYIFCFAAMVIINLQFASCELVNKKNIEIS